jgi:hypothetical protein
MLSIDRVLGNTHCVLACVACSLWHCHSAFLDRVGSLCLCSSPSPGYATQVSAKGHWRRNVGPLEGIAVPTTRNNTGAHHIMQEHTIVDPEAILLQQHNRCNGGAFRHRLNAKAFWLALGAKVG